MMILALEFSSDERSVAVLSNNCILGTAVETVTRETRAVQLIESALAAAKLEREAIDCIAVGLGPGSYTGIRSAIALAQGWQLARPITLLGIPSAECLAAQAHRQGWRGPVNIVIDAQRNEFYLGRYELEADGYRESTPLKIVSSAEIKAGSDLGEIVAGPSMKKRFAFARELFPCAQTLGQLAAQRTDFVSGEALVPVYLRETTFVKAPPARVLPER